MKNKKNIIFIAIIIMLIILFLTIMILNGRNKVEKKEKNLKIVTSFYPIYIMTKNITKDVPNVEVENMIEKNVGCIHDYTLMTSDLKKLEDSKIFIQNGLGIENFIDTIMETYPNIEIIDCSKGIDLEENHDEKLSGGSEEIQIDNHGESHKEIYSEENTENDGEEHKHNEEHEHNAHIWISFDKYIKEVKQISKSLSESDKVNASRYKENADEYIKEIKKLQERYKTELTNLEGNYVLSLNESFECLSENCNLNIITIETNHEESTFSAENLKQIIDKVKEKNIKSIIVDKEDALKNAQAISEETGAQIVTLDSALTGEDDTNQYIKIMEDNLEILKTTK